MTLLRLGLVFVLVAFTGVLGCASRPRLYPNQKYESVGEASANKDIDGCMAKADAHVKNEKSKQVVKGAGTGAVMGGVIGGLFSGGMRGAVRGAAAGGVIGGAGGALSPERIKEQFVNRCLNEKGYDVIGWD